MKLKPSQCQENNSVKVIEIKKASGQFQSFLKKPTDVRNNRNQTNRLRVARSNDTQKSNQVSNASDWEKKQIRKRKKQPSESIESNRNEQKNSSSTFRMFSNITQTKNHNYNSTIISNKKFESLPQQSKMVNISHVWL